MNRRLLPSGESAWLVECDDLDEVLALHAALAADPPDGIVDLVPAARTVLVDIDPVRLPLESAANWIDNVLPHRSNDVQLGADRASARASADRAPGPAPLVVPVTYDGDDLVETATVLGTSPEALVARHSSIQWRVAFIGFAPGFGYLVSEDWPFDVPRLDSPRTRVPTGAIALAAGFAGAYPRESPGGWRLIGRTDLQLWNADADEPAALTPGRTVRFHAAGPPTARTLP